jgi:ribonucleoside-diphosphate reductase alpha chain
MYMYGWKQGLKTTYYLRSRARTTIQKTTTADAIVDESKRQEVIACSLENPETCEACQ